MSDCGDCGGDCFSCDGGVSLEEGDVSQIGTNIFNSSNDTNNDNSCWSIFCCELIDESSDTILDVIVVPNDANKKREEESQNPVTQQPT